MLAKQSREGPPKYGSTERQQFMRAMHDRMLEMEAKVGEPCLLPVTNCLFSKQGWMSSAHCLLMGKGG